MQQACKLRSHKYLLTMTHESTVLYLNPHSLPQVGRIAEQLTSVSRKTTKTPLQGALDRLGGWIGAAGVGVLIVVVVVAILIGYRDPSHPDANPILSVRDRQTHQHHHFP